MSREVCEHGRLIQDNGEHYCDDCSPKSDEGRMASPELCKHCLKIKGFLHGRGPDNLTADMFCACSDLKEGRRTVEEIANKIMVEVSYSEPPFPMRKVQQIADAIKEALDTERQKVEALEAEVERLGAEGYACGKLVEHEGVFIGGCGLHVDREQSYRCSDCTASFHRDCIRKHFDVDAMIKARREVQSEIMTYKAKIEKLEAKLKEKDAALLVAMAEIELSKELTLHMRKKVDVIKQRLEANRFAWPETVCDLSSIESLYEILDEVPSHPAIQSHLKRQEAMERVVEAVKGFFSLDREQTSMGYLGKNPNFYKVNVDDYEKLMAQFSALQNLQNGEKT